MVDISDDGRLKSDGTQVIDMAKVLPPPAPSANHEVRRDSRDALTPITDRERDMFALDRRARFDLPIGSFEQLRATSEILMTLARGLEGLSYMRHKKERYVLMEARDLVNRQKRLLRNV